MSKNNFHQTKYLQKKNKYKKITLNKLHFMKERKTLFLTKQTCYKRTQT